jgi:DNA-damage-inducible protein J
MCHKHVLPFESAIEAILDNVAHLSYIFSQIAVDRLGPTMGKTSTIRARIEPNLKAKAEQIFHRLGLTTTQAITLFYKQVELKKGLPFDVAIPDEITLKPFADTNCGRTS